MWYIYYTNAVITYTYGLLRLKKKREIHTLSTAVLYSYIWLVKTSRGVKNSERTRHESSLNNKM